MPQLKVFLSYTGRDEVCCRLVTSRIKDYFSDNWRRFGEEFPEVSDWKVNRVPAGEDLLKVLSDRIADCHVFIPLITRDYGDEIAGWEALNWASNWSENKRIVPLIIEREGIFFWEKLKERFKTGESITYEKFPESAHTQVHGESILLTEIKDDIDASLEAVAEWWNTNKLDPSHIPDPNEGKDTTPSEAALVVLGNPYNPENIALNNLRRDLTQSIQTIDGMPPLIDLGDGWGKEYMMMQADEKAAVDQLKRDDLARSLKHTITVADDFLVSNLTSDQDNHVNEKGYLKSVSKVVRNAANSDEADGRNFVWLNGMAESDLPKLSVLEPVGGTNEEAARAISTLLGQSDAGGTDILTQTGGELVGEANVSNTIGDYLRSLGPAPEAMRCQTFDGQTRLQRKISTKRAEGQLNPAIFVAFDLFKIAANTRETEILARECAMQWQKTCSELGGHDWPVFPILAMFRRQEDDLTDTFSTDDWNWWVISVKKKGDNAVGSDVDKDDGCATDDDTFVLRDYVVKHPPSLPQALHDWLARAAN